MTSARSGLRNVLSGLIVNTVSRLDVAVRDGRSYTQSRKYTGLSKGTSKTILLTNPESSYVDIEVTGVQISGSGTATYETFKNVNVTSTGTKMTPRNRSTSHADGSLANMYRGASFTGGSSFGPGVLSSGVLEVINQRGNTIDFIIKPGGNVLVQFTNNSGVSNNYHVRVAYQHRR